MDKDKLVNQPTPEPTEKTKAVLAAGVAITAIVALLSAFGVVVPEAVSDNMLTLFSAGFTLVTFITAYYKKNKASDV